MFVRSTVVASVDGLASSSLRQAIISKHMNARPHALSNGGLLGEIGTNPILKF
jgi:hypothetical protein